MDYACAERVVTGTFYGDYITVGSILELALIGYAHRDFLITVFGKMVELLYHFRC